MRRAGRVVTKAFVLAAGRGERMRPLTDTTPKPLLVVRGKPLIDWHLEALARAGVRRVVINTAWLEERIVEAVGDGTRFGLEIAYSREGRDHGGALETAGGLKKAFPLLDLGPGENFWWVSADVHAPDFDFATAGASILPIDGPWAKLWLADNPVHHPEGDFGIEGGLASAGAPRYTWTGIGLVRREWIVERMADLEPGTPAKLRPYLDAALAERRLAAEPWGGFWVDVGTPQRLAELNASQPTPPFR
jgi:MurNAc alpha-1-phosphate uridylyltransferase